MKFCCDKCEKVIEQGILGNFIGAQTIVIKSKLFNDETVILCNDCFAKLRDFLNQKADTPKKSEAEWKEAVMNHFTKIE